VKYDMEEDWDSRLEHHLRLLKGRGALSVGTNRSIQNLVFLWEAPHGSQ